MNLGTKSGHVVPDEGKNNDAALEKMASLAEINVEFNGELDLEEQYPELGSSVLTGSGDRGPGERSVSPDAAEVSSHGALEANGDPVGSGISAQVDPVDRPKQRPTKGYGLKKWRRIRRDLSKDVTSSPDSAQILKRRLPLAERSKAHDDSRHKSDAEGDVEGGEGEDSVASVTSMNIGGTPFIASTTTLDPEINFLASAASFNIGIDSENSDDQSSKSSTAASAPRPRYDQIGFGRDRSRAKAVGGKGSGNIAQQRAQRGKAGRSEASRKFRENQIRAEMENSYSSAESDVRSSNVASVQPDSMASNSKQNEISVNNNGEHSDDAQRNGEIRSFYKENESIENSFREDLNADMSGEENNTKGEISRPGSDHFLESIASLQATKEALENEIKKLEELGKGKYFDDYDSQYEETEGIITSSGDANFVQLNQKLEPLECKLREAITNLKAKESKVTVLEAILNRAGSSNEKHSTDPAFLPDKCKELEIDLDNLLEKRIASEIEYLIMKRTTRSWKVRVEDHISLLEEENSQTMMLEVKNSENKSMMFKKRAEELEKDLAKTEEALRFQSRVIKYSLCFFVQMLIIRIAVSLFIMYLIPSSSGVAPT